MFIREAGLGGGSKTVANKNTGKNTGSGIKPTQYMNNQKTNSSNNKPVVNKPVVNKPVVNKPVQFPGSYNGFTPITNFTKDENGKPNTPDQRIISSAINNSLNTATKGNSTANDIYQAQKLYENVIKPSLPANNTNPVSDPITYPQNPVSDVNPTVDTNLVYNELLQAMMERNEQARQEAIDAILSNLDAVKGTYKSQLQTVIDEYNKLVDENEVAKDRARRMVKENQANRGQLDSGLGRQERLNLDIGYDNKTADINLARQQAVNEIYNLIAQAEAEAKANKASVNNQYNNSLLEWQIANS